MLRAITRNGPILESELMVVSVTPSDKYSWFGSPFVFWKGKTAIESMTDDLTISVEVVNVADGTQLWGRGHDMGAGSGFFQKTKHQDRCERCE